MPTRRANGVCLNYELAGGSGSGVTPLVLVHGSWVDLGVWDGVGPQLADSFRVLTYDRRGHGASEGSRGQGSIDEDAEDLSRLIEELGLAPAHIAGTSWGGSIVLTLASKKPQLFRTLAVHEPPLFDLVRGDRECVGALARLDSSLAMVHELLFAGRLEEGARHYVEEVVGLGTGGWQRLPEQARERYVAHAHTYLDQSLDPGRWNVDLRMLGQFRKPALLTHGDRRPRMFSRILDRLERALPYSERMKLAGTAHDPQVSHPESYARVLEEFASRARPETGDHRKQLVEPRPIPTAHRRTAAGGLGA